MFLYKRIAVHRQLFEATTKTPSEINDHSLLLPNFTVWLTFLSVVSVVVDYHWYTSPLPSNSLLTNYCNSQPSAVQVVIHSSGRGPQCRVNTISIIHSCEAKVSGLVCCFPACFFTFSRDKSLPSSSDSFTVGCNTECTTLLAALRSAFFRPCGLPVFCV